jgi:hypothetical protein
VDGRQKGDCRHAIPVQHRAGRRAEGAVAAAAAREELEQLNPDLLDKASGDPSAACEPGPESKSEGDEEGKEGGEGSGGGSEEGT